MHVVSRVLPDGFASLTDCNLAICRNGAWDRRTVADRGDYARILEEIFGLTLADSDLAKLRLFD